MLFLVWITYFTNIICCNNNWKIKRNHWIDHREIRDFSRPLANWVYFHAKSFHRFSTKKVTNNSTYHLMEPFSIIKWANNISIINQTCISFLWKKRVLVELLIHMFLLCFTGTQETFLQDKSNKRKGRSNTYNKNMSHHFNELTDPFQKILQKCLLGTYS